MGTCYSKSGHDAAESNTRSQPIPKDSTSSRHQPNGSLYVYRPVKDKNSQPVTASQSGASNIQEKGEEVVKINTIDSGIESLTSSQCNKETKELAENSELREATDTFELIDNGPCACGENCEVNGHCKFECLTKLPESNVEWTSGPGRQLPPQQKKCVEANIPVVHRKPRCKGRIERKSSRLSWKSTDSLDWTRTMVTSMDRTTSQVSDIFVDDVSLHAPLAHFDSIEFSGEDKDGDTASVTTKSGLKTVVAIANNSNGDISTFTNCSSTVLLTNNNNKCASVCDKRVESVERLCVQSTDNIMLATRESKIQDLVKKQLSSQSLLGSREGDSSSIAGSLLCFPPKSEVTSVVVDGKEVVLIDADTYSQVMDEIALLKMKLGQLTSVIQTMDTTYSYDRSSFIGTPALMAENTSFPDDSNLQNPLGADLDEHMLVDSPPPNEKLLLSSNVEMAACSPELPKIKDCTTEIPEPAPPEPLMEPLPSTAVCSIAATAPVRAAVSPAPAVAVAESSTGPDTEATKT